MRIKKAITIAVISLLGTSLYANDEVTLTSCLSDLSKAQYGMKSWMKIGYSNSDIFADILLNYQVDVPLEVHKKIYEGMEQTKDIVKQSIDYHNRVDQSFRDGTFIEQLPSFQQEIKEMEVK